MFALDVEKDATWCSWQPGVTEGSNSDVDTSQVDIVYRENSIVGRVCGHLWLDLDTLINMCSNEPGPSSVSGMYTAPCGSHLLITLMGVLVHPLIKLNHAPRSRFWLHHTI